MGTYRWINRPLKNVSKGIQNFAKHLIPAQKGWQGAAYGIVIIIVLQLLITGAFFIETLGLTVTVLFIMKFVMIGSLASLALVFFMIIIRKIPEFYSWILIGALVILLVFWPVSKTGKFAISAITILSASFFAGAFFSLKQRKPDSSLMDRIINLIFLFLGLTGLVFGGVFIFMEGVKSNPQENAAMKSVFRPDHIKLENPSVPGRFTVAGLTYGSGKDKHRKEFGKETDIRTDPVDGSRFVTGWDKFNGWVRTRYWGFEEDSLPLNASVWYPDTSGAFPLVIIVHGNHFDRDYSDPGYEYLGKLLASRGFIVASVDENFLNGSWGNIFKSLEEENDCRGWLLLKHLEQWHIWNKDTANIFFSRVDTGNIALIGHSRGGEAVAIAACFNKLPYYPDDATVPFSFGFNIRSIIAIAPVDGQYMPSETGTFFSNVDYFVLQGSNDMDMQSYHGARQFQRITFNDDQYHFKAGLYIFGANHGQFNTRWGRNDVGYPGIAVYNRKQIMPENDQEMIGKVYISAFLEATLHHQNGYVALFQDYRAGMDWLPETIYLNQFEDTYCSFICNYQEDIDLTTTTQKGGIISMENLTVWKEMTVPLKWGSQDTRAVYLGWSNKEKDSLVASYTITQSKEEIIPTDSSSYLYMVLADANNDSNPHQAKNTDEGEKSGENRKKKLKGSVEEINDEGLENEPVGTENESKVESKMERNKDSKEDKKDKNKPRESIDFSIQITDTTGHEAMMLLSDVAFLQPQIETKIMKADFMTDNASSEIVFRNYIFPLALFNKMNPSIDLNCIQTIKLIFNRTDEGMIILDNAGFRKSSK